MPRELTDEHKAAMAAGRERQLAEERAARLNAEAAYSEWCQEDARLWREYAASPGRFTEEGERRYREWSENLRRMPSLP